MLYSLLLQDSVALRVEVPGSVRTGERVPVVLRLVNKTERQVTLLLQGRPIVFDVTVAREDGAVVWRRLEGQVSGAILALRVLAPAESLTFEAEWDGRAASGAPVPPGRYVVTGSLPTDTPAGLTSVPATVDVRPTHRSR